MTSSVSLAAAFLGGILSFISPCVLPLVPGYLSFIFGSDARRVAQRTERGRPVESACASSARRSPSSSASPRCSSRSARRRRSSARWVGKSTCACSARSAAWVILLFGLHTMGLLAIGWLYTGKARSRQTEQARPTPVGAFLVGLAFAFGWTPCISPNPRGHPSPPHGTQDTVGQGVTLLAVYFAGPRHPVPAHLARGGPLLQGLRRAAQVDARGRGRLRRAADRRRPAARDRPPDR